MISMMRVGVSSMVGSFAISGMPTIADNTCRVFQEYGAISEHGSIQEAVRYARNFGSGLPDKLIDKKTSQYFKVMHELICEEVAQVPPSLVTAFSTFEAQPSKLGIVRYFNLLADHLEGALKKR